MNANYTIIFTSVRNCQMKSVNQNRNIYNWAVWAMNKRSDSDDYMPSSPFQIVLE